jgi:hypothetical protein
MSTPKLLVGAENYRTSNASDDLVLSQKEAVGRGSEGDFLVEASSLPEPHSLKA